MAELDDKKSAVLKTHLVKVVARLPQPPGVPAIVTQDLLNGWSEAYINELLNRQGGWVH